MYPVENVASTKFVYKVSWISEPSIALRIEGHICEGRNHINLGSKLVKDSVLSLAAQIYSLYLRCTFVESVWLRAAQTTGVKTTKARRCVHTTHKSTLLSIVRLDTRYPRCKRNTSDGKGGGGVNIVVVVLASSITHLASQQIV